MTGAAARATSTDESGWTSPGGTSSTSSSPSPQVSDRASRILSTFTQRWPVTLGIECYDLWWGKILPQIGASEECVLRAIDCLTSATVAADHARKHAKDPVLDVGARKSYVHGLEQYNKAIQALKTRRLQVVSGNETALLICSILFTAVGFVCRQQDDELHHFVWGACLLRMHLLTSISKNDPS